MHCHNVDLPVPNMSAAADICAKRMAASRQRNPPAPPTRESPPRPAKSAALASITSQSHRPSPQDCPDYVPVAKVVKESSRRSSICSVSTADRAAASYELSEYEQFHEANIERNNARLHSLGLLISPPAAGARASSGSAANRDVAAARRTGDTLGSLSSSNSRNGMEVTIPDNDDNCSMSDDDD